MKIVSTMKDKTGKNTATAFFIRGIISVDCMSSS